jgi:predicted DNA-binding protein (UPF0251 family)
VPVRKLSRVWLRPDQLESVRLADLEGLYHEEAARRMGVSRQTFGRIVESARRGIADAIINRKCLSIEGGATGLQGGAGRQERPTVALRGSKIRGGVHHGAHR